VFCFSVLFVVYTCTSIFICGTSCIRSAGYFKTGTSILLQPTRRVFHSTAIQPSSRVRISSFKVIIIIRLFTPSRRHPDPVPGHRKFSLFLTASWSISYNEVLLTEELERFTHIDWCHLIFSDLCEAAQKWHNIGALITSRQQYTGVPSLFL
jgi:hypothetical protein